ncbi:MAG: hypothetical protein Q9159_003925 [Coniocarpon cinnabarinum]
MAQNSSREAAQDASFNVTSTASYRAKNAWPPDFATLTPKYQLRLERRYKRRAQLKWARPRLMAWTRVAQWTAGIGIAVYGVFFMDWGKELQSPDRTGSGPFEGARIWLKDAVEDLQGAREHKLRKSPDD